ncbi:hypothetical protein [Clostridium sp. Marseille-P299]|uniref:hypothetical protein n=1 Tax=Clostridium sp. Marseille-P299 TaxID=1805477 RepID=UPI00082A445B|nr:hypothetical protein [Clostridium sp. Marseille-P299]
MKILKILFYNDQLEFIEKKYIKEFKVNEEYIIEQCILRYSTNEPCIIYRTLVINSTHIMLDDYFRDISKSKRDKIEIRELPYNVFYAIEFPDNAMFLEVSI